ncbi:MAG: HAMP domain-containing sensor histidine kinase [Acidimicrobiales bacterium]
MRRSPRWTSTIRFRLALNYGLVVFAFGSLLVGGLYVFQARQLDEPVVAEGVVVEGAGQRFALLTGDEVRRTQLELFEREVNKRSLEQLRRNSLFGVAALALISSAAGWSLAGTALRPVKAINAVARDITGSDLSRRIEMPGPPDELKELADTFDGMLDRVQDAFEEQRRFVHEASHELRNPLAIARSNLELALTAGGRIPEASDDDDELRRAAVIAYRSTGRMSVLVDDLLEQARNGVSELKQTCVDVNRLLTGLAGEYRAAAGAAAVHLDLSGIGATPLEVLGDEPALRRAVVNLVANALRLAPAGSTISLASRAVDGWIELEVRDEGPGIDPADHESVFQRFWRGNDVGAGSGLGLSIVRRIAERHGGSVVLDSALGEGARFVIRLPDQRGSSARLTG